MKKARTTKIKVGVLGDKEEVISTEVDTMNSIRGQSRARIQKPGQRVVIC